MLPLNDKVFTDVSFAKKIIDYFKPTGICYDPCRGFGTDKSGKEGGAFFNQLPEPKRWAEIEEGKNCLDFNEKVDWAITNPPYSAKAYREVSSHCFNIAENVVLLTRVDVAIGTFARINDAKSQKHYLKELILCDYKDAGFAPRGFTLGVFHWERGWNGGTKWSDWRK